MSLVKINEIKPGIWELELNRVDKLNAFSNEMIQDFNAALQELKSKAEEFQVQVLLISSATTKAFSAGADLSERMKMSAAEVPEALDKIGSMINALEAFELPTIAVMEGIAFGGGLELALACDLRVAAPTAQMGLTETRLAIIPGAGGTQRLARLVGLGLAKEWIFTAKKISATEAAAAGLVNYCCENPKQKAIELAEEISKAAPIAIRAAKKAITGGWNLELKDALHWERKCYLKTLNTQDRVEGLAAFVEKRSPRYQGK
jgi:methylglutaconyl-CoA hydratase